MLTLFALIVRCCIQQVGTAASFPRQWLQVSAPCPIDVGHPHASLRLQRQPIDLLQDPKDWSLVCATEADIQTGEITASHVPAHKHSRGVPQQCPDCRTLTQCRMACMCSICCTMATHPRNREAADMCTPVLAAQRSGQRPQQWRSASRRVAHICIDAGGTTHAGRQSEAEARKE